MGGDGFDAYGVEVVDGLCEGSDAGKVGGTSLKLEGEVGPGGALKRDVGYHLAASLIGGHLLKQCLPAIEDADACGATHLVGREDVEVGVEGADIDVHVADGLCAVDKHGDAVAVGLGYHLGNGVDRAEDVGDVAHGDKARALVEERAVCLHVEDTTGIHRDDTQGDTLVAPEKLPRDDVGVVLHDGEYNLIAILKEIAVGGSHEVDGLGGATGEDDLLDGGGVDHAAHALAGDLLQVGGLLRQGMDAPVDVGLVLKIHAVDGIDHAAWSL